MPDSTDYSRKWIVLATVAISILVATISSGIVNVALPTLVAELDSTFTSVQWVVLIYVLTQATLMPIIGRLGDMVGRKVIFVNGFVVFGIGSLLCGLSPTVYWLIAFRVIQAVGGAMMLTLAFAIIVDAFPTSERGRAIGSVSIFSSTGIVLGPVIGGFMLASMSWRWLFFVTAPVSLLGLLLAVRFVADSKPVAGQRFDYLGAATLFISLLTLLLALTSGPGIGYGDGRILALFGIAVLLFVAFVVVELRVDQPMIDPRLFSNHLFTVNLTSRLISFIAMAGTVLLLPFYLESVLGYSARQVGLFLTVIPLCLGIFSPLAGMAADRVGARKVMTLGVLLLVLGYYSLTTLDEQTTSLGIVLRLLPVGLGMGTFQAPNNSAIMGAVPVAQLGITSGLVSLSRTLGQALGVAIVGALWAARTMASYGAALPGGVTTAPPAAQVAGLQDALLAVTILVVVALVMNGRLLFQKRPLAQTAETERG